jgi:hypothetical protein
MDQSNSDRTAKARPADLNSTTGHSDRQRPDGRAAGIVVLAVQRTPKNALNQRYKSSPYTRPWSRSSRDHRGCAPRAKRSRLTMSLMH